MYQKLYSNIYFLEEIDASTSAGKDLADKLEQLAARLQSYCLNMVFDNFGALYEFICNSKPFYEKKIDIRSFMRLFLIRFILAIAFYICVLFSVQISAIAGMILVGGYRSFLILSPYANKIFGKRDLLCSIIITLLGIIIYFFFQQHIFGAFLIAVGLSVAGFIIKAIAAEMPSTSALNKVAITSANIGAGAILFITNNDVFKSITIVFVLLLLSCLIKMPRSNKRSHIQPLTIKNILENRLSNLVWLFFGMAIGVRVFGMYIIMPNYLLNTLGNMPQWYGITLISYGIMVIFTQLPVIYKKISFSLRISITALGFSCFIMGLPNLFYIETFIGAIIWCLCLAIEELFAPFIDFHAAKSNHLFVKEISIGIGGMICFLISLTNIKTEILSLISILFIIAGMFFYKKALKQNVLR